jgi:hypothetical protein
MLNLDQAIADWRKQMLAAGIRTPVPLDELENHLREDIEQQVRCGVPPERAFALAVERIGDAKVLNREFEKTENLGTLRKRKLLYASSVLAGAALVYSIVFVAWFIERRRGNIEITRTEFFLVLGAMFATILFGFIGRYFAKFLPVVTSERSQAALIVAVVFLGGGLFRWIFSFLSADNLVHMQIILLWVLSPLLGFGHCFSEWCDRCVAARRARAANV